MASSRVQPQVSMKALCSGDMPGVIASFNQPISRRFWLPFAISPKTFQWEKLIDLKTASNIRCRNRNDVDGNRRIRCRYGLVRE